MLRFSVPAILCLAAAALGQTPPIDLSGTWKMDPSRSESAHQAVPIGPVTLIIKQTPTELQIETRRGGTGKAKPETELVTYKLDGTESVTTGKNGAPIRSRARWEGEKLITGTIRDVQGATVTTQHVHTLDPSGSQLTIHRTLTVQHGYQFEGAQTSGSGVDVFVKVKLTPSAHAAK